MKKPCGYYYIVVMLIYFVNNKHICFLSDNAIGNANKKNEHYYYVKITTGFFHIAIRCVFGINLNLFANPVYPGE